MRAIVTGGAGFIGSHLVDRLIEEGHTVAAVDDLTTGSLANLEGALANGALLEQLDIVDGPLERFTEGFHPEVVFHLAAQPSVTSSVSDPVHDARVNILGALRVLEAARAAGARKVVFAASGGTLYRPGDAALPLTEEAPRGAESPYGISKAVVLEYLAYYRRNYGLDWTAPALANVYGPRQDPHGEAGVVAIFTDLARRGEPLTIYGDGEQTRDFVHVHDVVSAFVAAASRADGRVVNIGTAVETSVNELARLIVAASGADLPVEHLPERAGEVRRSALSPALAARVLGWQPALTLSEGIGTLIAPTEAVGARA